MSCPSADLDAFVRSELSPGAAAEVASHLESCRACQREVSWLRTEIALAQRHADATATSSETLWSGIEQRIASTPPVRAFKSRLWAPLAAIAPAAAVLILAIRTQSFVPKSPTQRPLATKAGLALQRSLEAVSAAERDYRAAVDQLEAEYRVERTHLEPEEAMRWDATLELARARLGEARLAASSDVDGQMKVLRGYSAYVHTLHRAVTELQESGK